MWRAFGVDPVKQLSDFAFKKRPDVMDRCKQKSAPHSHSLNKAPKFQTPLTARRLRLETKTLLHLKRFGESSATLCTWFACLLG
jgi:hypothetical protein